MEIQEINDLEYKMIPDFNSKYAITTGGQVISFCDRKPKILKQNKLNSGYLYVSLQKGKTAKHYTVHRLLALTYLGSAEGRQVNHINGNKEDNRLENIEWCTPKENRQHARNLDTHKKGTQLWNSKLTVEQVRKIMNYKKIVPRITQKELASILNICQQHVSDIYRRKKWSHII